MRCVAKAKVSASVLVLLLTMSLALALSPIGAGTALASPGWENKTPSIPNIMPAGFISAVDANIAWLAGFDISTGPIGGGATPVTIRTIDGGATWTSNPMPALPGVTFQLTAADANTAWAATFMANSAVILKTSDGGRTWTQQFAYSGGGFVKITAIDANTAWAIGEYGSAGVINTAVLKTTDGGANWAVKVIHAFTYNPNAGFPNLVLAIPDISACSADVAWVVEWDFTSNPPYQAAFVWRTADGGATWLSKTVPALTYASYIAAADQDNAWVSDGKSIWNTKDGGSIWSVRASGVNTNLGITMKTFGPDVLWMGLDQGRVMRTIDDGTTWNVQTPGGSTNVFLSASDANTAWAVMGDPTEAAPYVLRTTDGGGLPAFLPLKVTGINPASGVNNANYAVEVLGSGFQPGATARLVQGATVINGAGPTVAGSGRLTCYFDLTSKPLGKYDVIVKNPDNQEAMFAKGFTVTDPCGQGGGAAISLFAGLVGLLSLAGLGMRRKRA
jgi:photosystem II stability/assembly factor-like uncharacterized protein